MFKTNFIIATRSLKKHLVYTWINVLGLGVALCCVFMTYVYVSHEVSFDTAYPESETLHRLVMDGMNSDIMSVHSNLSYVSTEGVKEAFPAVEEIARGLFAYNSELVRSKDRYDLAFEEKELVYTESSFIAMFGLKVQLGDGGQLERPNTVLISEKVAEKYFEGTYAIGKLLLIGDSELEVVGVYKDFPSNTSISPEFVISLQTLKVSPDYEQHFNHPMMLLFQTFLKLNPGTDKATLAEQLTTLARDKKVLVSGVEEYILEPIQDYHFTSSDYMPQFKEQADERLMTWLIAISIGLLLVAIANFGNISLAVALSRTREVAVHKIIGAHKMQIIKRSLMESLLLSAMAFFVGLVFMELFQPDFERFVGRDLEQAGLGIGSYAILFAIAMGVGLIAGLYPSILISNIKVMSLFKSGLNLGNSRYSVKNLLMSFQFVITFVMLALTFFMNRQIDFMLSKDLGFDFENRLVMNSSWNYARDNDRSVMQNFENELMAMPEILDVTLSDVHPVSVLRKNALRSKKLEGGEVEQSILMAGIQCDFFDFYNIETSFGESISELFCTDGRVVVLNEAAINGFGDNVAGKILPHFKGAENMNFMIQSGSVKNFHLTSVKNDFVPLVFVPLINVNAASFFSIRVNDNVDQKLLFDKLNALWWKYEPSEPFRITALEDEHKRLYSSELKMKSMTSALAMAVCIIAFAGVFALSVFYGKQKLKEVGIRKILGASFGQLFILQSKTFFIILIISSLIAIPMVQLASDSWINQFAFRVAPSNWVYVFTGLTLILCTLLSSGWYSAKVARTNPSEIIRDN
ncbi:MAG: FtsX-like permease family protein [Roseivirga sp.]|nr:FtsX-like permease family protein [Roseivirga sp.]